MSLWAPQNGFTYINPIDPQLARIEWNFSWGDYRHLIELSGRHRGFEVKAAANSAFADRFGQYHANNFPSGSRAYPDTLFSDGATKNWGYGAADSNYLVAGVAYFAHLDVVRSRTISSGYEMKVSATAMTREDHSFTGCSYQVSLCTFPDYSVTVTRGRNFVVGNYKSWGTLAPNWLYNQSLEGNADGYALQPGNNRSVYCNGGGYRSNCFLEFNRGSNSWASVYQDVTPTYPIQAGDNYTAESMVRCPVNQVQCSLNMTYWGLGGGDEGRGVDFTLPSDGRWYMCRTDIDHGGSAGFARPHNRLRWELYNRNNNNVDVDFTTLAMPVSRITSTQGDGAPAPSIGNVCELADIYDS